MGGGFASEVTRSIWSEKPLNRQRSWTPSRIVRIPGGVCFSMNWAIQCVVFGNALPCYQDGNVKANSLSILSGEGCGCVRRLDCHSWWGWGDATGVYKAQDGPPRQRIIQPKSVVSRWGSSLLRALRASTHVILATILQANVSSCAPFTDGKRRVGDIPRTVQGHSRTCWSQDTNSGMCDVGRPYLRPWDRPPLCRCAPPHPSPVGVFTHGASALRKFWKDIHRSYWCLSPGSDKRMRDLIFHFIRTWLEQNSDF